MHFVDLYWQVMPTLHPEGLRPSLWTWPRSCRRRLLRGVGELAMRRQALVQCATRACRIRSRSRTSEIGQESRVETHRLEGGAFKLRHNRCPHGEFRIEFCDETEFLRRLPALMTGGRQRGGRGAEVCDDKETSMREREQVVAGGVLVDVFWPGVAAAARRHRNRHLRREAPVLRPIAMDAEPVCAKKHQDP